MNRKRCPLKSILCDKSECTTVCIERIHTEGKPTSPDQVPLGSRIGWQMGEWLEKLFQRTDKRKAQSGSGWMVQKINIPLETWKVRNTMSSISEEHFHPRKESSKISFYFSAWTWKQRRRKNGAETNFEPPTSIPFHYRFFCPLFRILWPSCRQTTTFLHVKLYFSHFHTQSGR